MTTPPKIPALWFTADGRGPDALALELQPFSGETGGLRASLGIQLRKHDDLIIHAAPVIDSGIFLYRDQVEELHRQLSAWLAKTAPGPRAA